MFTHNLFKQNFILEFLTQIFLNFYRPTSLTEKPIFFNSLFHFLRIQFIWKGKLQHTRTKKNFFLLPFFLMFLSCIFEENLLFSLLAFSFKIIKRGKKYTAHYAKTSINIFFVIKTIIINYFIEREVRWHLHE